MGQKVETMPLGEGFMGIELEAGTHQVEISYCPTGFVMGLILSFISLALLVVIETASRKAAPAPCWNGLCGARGTIPCRRDGGFDRQSAASGGGKGERGGASR